MAIPKRTNAVAPPSRRFKPDKYWLAWAAGFFDGEGCVGIQIERGAGRANYTLIVQIGQNDRRPLDQFAAVWGGNIWSRPQTNRQKETFYWRAASHRAATMLRDLLPYLLVKKRHGVRALRFQDGRVAGKGGNTNFLTAKELSRRERYYHAFRAMNWRGLGAYER